MAKIDKMKQEILLMLELSKEIGMYHQQLLFYNDITNKMYSENKVDLIRTKLNTLEDQFYSLKEKYF
jgi:hypothetical protein